MLINMHSTCNVHFKQHQELAKAPMIVFGNDMLLSLDLLKFSNKFG